MRQTVYGSFSNNWLSAYSNIVRCILNSCVVRKVLYTSLMWTGLFFKAVISILVISNHTSFRVLFEKNASVYFI